MKKLLAKAAAFHEKDLFLKVLPITSRILSETRDDEAALFYHAFALRQCGKPKRAIRYWQRLKKLNPQQFNLHLNLGVCYADIGDFPRANQNYKRELALYTNSLQAIYNLGINYYRAHKYKLAAKYLERCNSQKHSVEDIVCKLAHSYFKTGQLGKEQVLYEEHLATHPNDTWALNNLGAHLMGQAEYHRALLRLKKAERLDPTNAMVKRNVRKAESILKELKASKLAA